MEITIRRATPDDAEDIARIFDTPRALRGTLQVPYTSVEFRRRRMSEVDDTLYPLAAVVDGEVVGQLTLHGITRPRRKHAAGLGMAVRDDMQGQGVGTALMQACVDLAVRLGDRVEAGQPLYRLHACYEADLAFARSMAEADSLGVAEASMYQTRPLRSAAIVFTHGIPWIRA